MTMAKFKKGDRVRFTKDFEYAWLQYRKGDISYVSQTPTGRYVRLDSHALVFDAMLELATPSPIPDTVTIGGVEYVRKPKPEHVWAWGQWARVSSGSEDYDGKVGFVLGPIDKNGWVPVSFIGALGERNTDGIHPHDPTYISTTTIPE